jgi:flavin reductase (DIM6/NTAB) family NADH-FMN oxidoreductase RutF
MYYEPGKTEHGLRYNPLKGCVVPRPIGWISSMSKDGLVNLAPFSFFNLLSYDPPYVCFSAAGNVKDHEPKDTVVNIEETGEFVYNLATWNQREQMTKTALIVDRGVDEMAAAGLEPLPSKLVRPPRVGGAPVHFECKYHQTVILPGNRPVSFHRVVFGKVVAVHIDDDVITDGVVDVLKMRPISRLGYKDYTSVDSIFQMEKALPEEALTPRREAAE